MIKCTTIGVEPSNMCYEICVMAKRCGALKAWEREHKNGHIEQMKREEQVMDVEEFNKFMNDLKTLVLEHPIVADWWVEISGRKDIPDVVERKYGEWVWVADDVDWYIGTWCCSECQSRNNNIPHYPKTNPLIWDGTKYCANCGADMRGQKHE